MRVLRTHHTHAQAHRACAQGAARIPLEVLHVSIALRTRLRTIVCARLLGQLCVLLERLACISSALFVPFRMWDWL